MIEYEGRVFRPPSEAYSLIVQVTIGCSHNKCTFCDMYKEKRFRVRKLEVEFKQNMNLQGGDYLISFGCTGFKMGTFTVYHRLYDLLNLNVVAKKNSVGYFDMNSEVHIVEG